MNTQAFRAGRLVVADPDVGRRRVKTTRLGAAAGDAARSPREARALVDRVGADGELRRLLEIRVPELIDYQDARLRARSTSTSSRACARPSGAPCPARRALSEAVARYLFKLMAYKDEYEVARLHLTTDLGAGAGRRVPGRRAASSTTCTRRCSARSG